jgi:hypothetical protein
VTRSGDMLRQGMSSDHAFTRLLPATSRSAAVDAATVAAETVVALRSARSSRASAGTMMRGVDGHGPAEQAHGQMEGDCINKANLGPPSTTEDQNIDDSLEDHQDADETKRRSTPRPHATRPSPSRSVPGQRSWHSLRQRQEDLRHLKSAPPKSMSTPATRAP